MTTELVQCSGGLWVRRGTAKAGWKTIRGRELMVVSAEMPDGKREDIDSSACAFMASGVVEHINAKD
jgi:hypothetical protein